MGFLKFLFIAIIVLTIIRIVVSRLFPWILRYFARKMQEKAFGQYQARTENAQEKPRSHSKRAEGKIHIDYVPPESKPNSGAHKAGEFVDFEEIR